MKILLIFFALLFFLHAAVSKNLNSISGFLPSALLRPAKNKNETGLFLFREGRCNPSGRSNHSLSPATGPVISNKMQTFKK